MREMRTTWIVSGVAEQVHCRSVCLRGKIDERERVACSVHYRLVGPAGNGCVYLLRDGVVCD